VYEEDCDSCSLNLTEFPESCDTLFLLARDKTDEDDVDSKTSFLLSRLTEKIFHDIGFLSSTLFDFVNFNQ